jgi:hypothetical protein
MAEVSVELRERLRNDQAFRDRFMDEVLLQLAIDSDLVDKEGNFMDPNANMRQNAVDARVGGRPVFHYFGLSLEQVENMGLSQEEIEQLGQYMELKSDPDSVGDPTAFANGPLQAHPGASLWSPPPPLPPDQASTQNPSGATAAETANTPAAVSPMAVHGLEDKTRDVGAFERAAILEEGRRQSVMAATENQPSDQQATSDAPKTNAPQDDAPTTDPPTTNPPKTAVPAKAPAKA